MQLDRLKQALGQNTKEGLLNNNSSSSSDKFNSSDDRDDNSDFEATRDSSPANRSNCDSNRDSNLDFGGLPYNYLCGGSPDKMLMEALKKLNISNIKDFLNNDKSKPFEKQKRKLQPQYHIESSRGDVND